MNVSITVDERDAAKIGAIQRQVDIARIRRRGISTIGASSIAVSRDKRIGASWPQRVPVLLFL